MYIFNKAIGSVITTFSLGLDEKINDSLQMSFMVSTHEDYSLIYEPRLCVGPVATDSMTLRLHLTTHVLRELPALRPASGPAGQGDALPTVQDWTPCLVLKGGFHYLWWSLLNGSSLFTKITGILKPDAPTCAVQHPAISVSLTAILKQWLSTAKGFLNTLVLGTEIQHNVTSDSVLMKIFHTDCGSLTVPENTGCNTWLQNPSCEIELKFDFVYVHPCYLKCVNEHFAKNILFSHLSCLL